MQFIKTLVIRKNYNRAHPQNQLSLEDIYYRDKRKVLSKEDENYIDIWLNWNEGYLTYPYFVNLPVEQQRQILNFLNDAYVILPQTIKEKNYLFVHAAPPEDLEMIKDKKILRNDSEGFIRIDTGLSHTDGQCSLYCIEDDNVEYIERRAYDLQSVPMK